MTSMQHDTCPAPCPFWCTREEGHALYVDGGWRRIHIGAPTETPAGPVMFEQSDTVTAAGVEAGPLMLGTQHGALPVRLRAVA